MNPNERLEELEKILDELREANEEAPVLVEGPRDAASLRELGLAGAIRTLHGTTSVLGEADRAAHETRRLIVLTDWDRTGGARARRLRENLSGRVAVDLEFRRRLARVALVKCVEDLPAFRRALLKRVGNP